MNGTLGLLSLLASLAAAGPPAPAGGPPAPRLEPALSSATLRDPYDLVRGTASPPPELAGVPWFGERLEYEVKWGLFTVGHSSLEASRLDDFRGAPAVRLVSQAVSNGFCDAFYKVRDLNESWIDARRFHSLGYRKILREGGFFRNEWVLYDYPRKSWLSQRVARDGSVEWRAGSVPGFVQDVLSSMYYLRTKPLKVGDEVILDVNTRENWPLVVKVLEKTRKKVPAGTFDVLIVEPFVRKEGIFIQKGRSLKVWLTDDHRLIPVYLAVEVFFGDISAALVKATGSK